MNIRYQAKSEQNVRQDPMPRVRHGEAALMHPHRVVVCFDLEFEYIVKNLKCIISGKMHERYFFGYDSTVSRQIRLGYCQV